jgi:hypothetical protein
VIRGSDLHPIIDRDIPAARGGYEGLLPLPGATSGAFRRFAPPLDEVKTRDVVEAVFDSSTEDVVDDSDQESGEELVSPGVVLFQRDGLSRLGYGISPFVHQIMNKMEEEPGKEEVVWSAIHSDERIEKAQGRVREY